MRSRLSHWLFAAVLFAAAAVPASASPGWLGVSTQPTDADLRRGLDLTRDGLLVNRVFEGSPAERAGLKKGDVILRFDGKSVTESVDLRDAVRDAGSGRHAKIEVWRGNATRTFDVLLAELPPSEQTFEYSEPPTPPAPPAPRAAPAPPAPPADRSRAPELNRLHPPGTEADGDRHVRRRVFVNGRELTEDEIEDKMKELRIEGLEDLMDLKDLKDLRVFKDPDALRFWTDSYAPMLRGGARGRLGVRVEKLSSELGEALGVPSGKGVVVLEVYEDTPAQKAGLRAGDVITEVAGHQVVDRDDLARTLADREGAVEIVLTRKGARRTVKAELPARSRSQGFYWSPTPRSYSMRIPEPGRAPRVYRYQTERDGGSGDAELREEMDQLKQELRELKEQMGAKEPEQPKEPVKAKTPTPAPAPAKKK